MSNHDYLTKNCKSFFYETFVTDKKRWASPHKESKIIDCKLIFFFMAMPMQGEGIYILILP